MESVEKKRRLGGTRHRWEDNIKLDVKGMILIGVDQFRLQLKLAGILKNGNELLDFVKSWTLS